MALGFTHYMVDAQIPDRMVAWATGTIHSRWLFLLGLNLVLLVVGGLVEIYAAIVVVVPLLVPLGVAFGLDPVHLGIIFLANMELGFLAPPVGLNLLLSSYRFDKPMLEVARAVFPMLLVLMLGVPFDHLCARSDDLSTGVLQVRGRRPWGEIRNGRPVSLVKRQACCLESPL